MSLIRSLHVCKKYAFHLAMIGAQSATIYASERPWWEADVAAEMARVEAQNLYILSEIEAELRYHNIATFEQLERVSEYYLQQTERRWTEYDEGIIRNEVRRLSDSIRPYFDADRRLFEVDSYMIDRSKR
ncbi:MAG TPA: hypothetical protein DEF72_06575 [Gammaproteobacteria bacterium]|nr:hypothetical protein [Gammaproteobacteria bacterium]